MSMYIKQWIKDQVTQWYWIVDVYNHSELAEQKNKPSIIV